MVQLEKKILCHVINYTTARDQLHHIAPLVSYLLCNTTVVYAYTVVCLYVLHVLISMTSPLYHYTAILTCDIYNNKIWCVLLGDYS